MSMTAEDYIAKAGRALELWAEGTMTFNLSRLQPST